VERSTLAWIMFLAIFLLVYGGAHLYVFLKARAALGFGAKAGFLLVIWLLLMVFAPILTRTLERPGLEPAALVMAYIGYTWMGLLVLFFCISITIDVLRLLVYLAGLISAKNFSSLIRMSPYNFLVPLILSACCVIYGFFEAAHIRTERITIETSKLPQGIDRVKIVQISDIHLGVIVGEGKLKKILDIVKREDPDLLVSTGDLVDGEMCNLTGVVNMLREIEPPYGKFAVTGNHEFYAGLDKALAFTEDAGFTILRQETAEVGGFLNVVGVDDGEARRFGRAGNITEQELLSQAPQENFSVLLKHRPTLNQGSLGLFDLQLSGHAHRGQIFPFALVTDAIYPTDEGCLKLEDGSYLCVSKGAGTWGPPIRFLAPPDVMVIELIRR
jgi:predicted MPP superfamily phosphohydrolase